MASEQQIEVYRQHRTAQEKYVYFLLAAVGTAIALAVNQTQGAKLAWSQLPLAGAVFFWALSFYFSCRHLGYVESTLFANAGLLQVQSGQFPHVGRRPELMAAASGVIREAIESNSKWSRRFARWQFNSLLLGSISYLGWHVFEMWLRSLPNP
jgi:hypothetical protein